MRPSFVAFEDDVVGEVEVDHVGRIELAGFQNDPAGYDRFHLKLDIGREHASPESFDEGPYPAPGIVAVKYSEIFHAQSLPRADGFAMRLKLSERGLRSRDHPVEFLPSIAGGIENGIC